MKHGTELPFERCPHCKVANPRITSHWGTTTKSANGSNVRYWGVYVCASCGGLILAVSPANIQQDISESWPTSQNVSESIPARAREYLAQALNAMHAPVGAIMLTASAVDSMLKDKGYKDGSLFSRIDAAAKDHLITTEMAAWAHEIRLDANDQRHSDESVALPDPSEAAKAIEFASALAQFLYVLPARVARGRLGPTA